MKTTEPKTKHTPGPWSLETVKTSIGICHKIGPFPPHRPGDEPSHACIYVDEDDAESLANAALIAAAPELLEALRMLLDETNAGTWDCLPAEKARAAIAKAEGK